MGEHADPRLTESDAEIIKRKARALVGYYGFRTGDVEDLCQELAMHVVTRAHLYRPERGSRAQFVNTLAKNKLLEIIRSRTAQKRDKRRDLSMDDPGAASPFDRSTSPGRIDLQLDVRWALDRMPEDLRKVAMLRLQHSERALERLLGLTRAQVRTRLGQIRRFLREAGLAPDSGD